MTYLMQSKVADSATMHNRVAQAVTSEPSGPDGTQADQWTNTYRREWAAAPGWADAWASALALHPPETEPNYDPGADEGVITDAMILSQVQAMLATP